MLLGGNQTGGNSLERFLTPYQYSRLPLISIQCRHAHLAIIVKKKKKKNEQTIMGRNLTMKGS